jgi:hypothetical protein
MKTHRTSIAGILATLFIATGCATIGADASTEGTGSSAASDREDILQVMERDSRGG